MQEPNKIAVAVFYQRQRTLLIIAIADVRVPSSASMLSFHRASRRGLDDACSRNWLSIGEEP